MDDSTNDPLSQLRDLPGARSILIVDDIRAVRRATTRLLSEDGYRVFEAADAVEALEVLRQARGRIDVVLMDVVMPRVSGVDLVRLIRERWPEQPIVFMSAYPAEVLVREGLQELRQVLFLAKPFTRADLVRILERACAERPRRGNTGESHQARPSRDV
jgi:two-component system cell cycle sensor histidine kinase/response regulator CckA